MDNKNQVKTIGFIVAGLAAILLFSFLLGEKVSFKIWGLVDDDKIANFFTALESICFIATLFFASWQLEESRLARLASQKPNLRPSEYFFTWQNLTPGQVALANIFNPDNGRHYVTKVIQELTIELKNSSGNVANDVRCEWLYDTALVSEIIQGEHNTVLEIGNPIENPQTSIAIIEPTQSAIITLCRYYLLMWSGEQSFFNFIAGVQPQYPTLHLNISFSDISGNSYSERYLASVSYYEDDGLAMNFERIAS